MPHLLHFFFFMQQQQMMPHGKQQMQHSQARHGYVAVNDPLHTGQCPAVCTPPPPPTDTFIPVKSVYMCELKWESID